MPTHEDDIPVKLDPLPANEFALTVPVAVILPTFVILFDPIFNALSAVPTHEDDIPVKFDPSP